MSASGTSGKPAVERRSGQDRRNLRRFPPLFGGYRRRRSSGRRDTDQGYVDVYEFRTWAVAVSVLLLSFFDAVLTVLQISNGWAREANPIMYGLLEHGGPWAFFGAKAALTALAMAVIVVHKEWRLGRFAARLCLWSYVAVCVYHLHLIFGRLSPRSLSG